VVRAPLRHRLRADPTAGRGRLPATSSRRGRLFCPVRSGCLTAGPASIDGLDLACGKALRCGEHYRTRSSRLQHIEHSHGRHRRGMPMRRLTRALRCCCSPFPWPCSRARRRPQAQDNGSRSHPGPGLEQLELRAARPTAAAIEAQADAMKKDRAGQGGFPVRQRGRLLVRVPATAPTVASTAAGLTDSTKLPVRGGSGGGRPVHLDGLKFGLYVTPGIASRGRPEHPDRGHPYHAADIATGSTEATTTATACRASTTPSRAPRSSSTPGPSSSRLGPSTTSDRRGGRLRHPRRAGGSQALRQTGRPDFFPPRAVQRPGHQRRGHLEAVRERMA